MGTFLPSFLTVWFSGFSSWGRLFIPFLLWNGFHEGSFNYLLHISYCGRGQNITFKMGCYIGFLWEPKVRNRPQNAKHEEAKLPSTLWLHSFKLNKHTHIHTQNHEDCTYLSSKTNITANMLTSITHLYCLSCITILRSTEMAQY